ncbi:MAG: BrnT family toxin [Nitratireductor sp.]|nr:BrnT family toxin [Nitratireductor sp.]
MEFEWDEEKREKVLRERGIDFIDAAAIFEGPVFSWPDGRDYGEDRFIGIGYAGGTCIVVVYTQRDSAIRLITAWKGGRNDRAEYDARFTRTDQGDA